MAIKTLFSGWKESDLEKALVKFGTLENYMEYVEKFIEKED